MANEIRGEMARHRREIRAMRFKAGCAFAAELLERPDEIVSRMKLGYLLRSIHRVGNGRASEIAEIADATTSRRIGPMRVVGEPPPISLRQRALIADRLRELGR